VRERAPAQAERGEVDEAVTGRNEGRDVVQAVDVDTQPAREDVLHGCREHDDDGHLDAGRSPLAPKSGEEQQPGAGSEQPLLGERCTRVEGEHDQHPQADEPGDAEVTWPWHPSTIARRATADWG
jgi:hypothetical protein